MSQSTRVTELKDYTVVILAGGMGTRLKSKVYDRPKVLAEVDGRPWLSFVLDRLDAAGFVDVVLLTGFMGDAIEDEYGAKYKNLNIRYSREQNPLGTGGAIRNALQLISSEQFVVLNGDSYCEIDYVKLIAWHYARSAEITLGLVSVDDTSRYGAVDVEPDGRVIGFREKDSQASSNWINAGVYVLNKDVVRTMPKDKEISFERAVLPRFTSKRLFGFPCQDASFIDIGTPESYQSAGQFVSAIANVREELSK